MRSGFFLVLLAGIASRFALGLEPLEPLLLPIGRLGPEWLRRRPLLADDRCRLERQAAAGDDCVKLGHSGDGSAVLCSRL
jgi:hypothetical protein